MHALEWSSDECSDCSNRQHTEAKKETAPVGGSQYVPESLFSIRAGSAYKACRIRVRCGVGNAHWRSVAQSRDAVQIDAVHRVKRFGFAFSSELDIDHLKRTPNSYAALVGRP